MHSQLDWKKKRLWKLSCSAPKSPIGHKKKRIQKLYRYLFDKLFLRPFNVQFLKAYESHESLDISAPGVR